MAIELIPFHRLGKNGPKVPALGFGLMGMSVTAYGGTIDDDETRFKIFDRAVELGNTFWDTSDLYGDSETLLGKWFKRTGKRDQIFLASKFGFVPGPDITKPTFDSSGKYCKEACEKSLNTMGIEYMDLYYLHHPNRETPIEQTMRALAELKAEGKIKYIGLSNVNSGDLRRAVKIAPVAAVQVEYSPFLLDIENAEGSHTLQACRELGVSVVCYSPLGRGLVTTTFEKGELGADPKDLRAKVFPRFQEENREANMRVMREFAALAEKKGCTTSQLALAWLVKQDVVPIPGTRRIKYLEENWAALDVILSDEDEREIREFAQSAGIQGQRIPERFKHMIVDTKEEEM